MSVDIIVPALGESVSEANIIKWYKKEGDPVKIDELLLELETEKVTLELNATAEGVIESISCPENTTVSVGQTLGKIKAGAAVASQNSNSNPTSSDGNANISAGSGKASADQNKSDQTPNSLPNDPIAQSHDIIDDSNMSPTVRKMVIENNLDIKSILGSGKNGRLTKTDLLNVINARSDGNLSNNANLSSNGPGNAAGNHEKKTEVVRMSGLRKTIAKRLKKSQNTAAILSTFNEIDMSAVIKIRKTHKELFQKTKNIKLGFMSFFVKAVVSALKEFPDVNAEIKNDDIIYKYYYDIGVAVGTPNGLVVPIVRNADKMTFAEIEQEITNLAVKARTGKLSMKDLTDGTFSVTNGGVYGSLLSTPIINPPQSAIIGLHNTLERPVVIDGKIEIRPMMYVALSYDHRIIDGKDAVGFLVKIKQLIEKPDTLLLDL